MEARRAGAQSLTRGFLLICGALALLAVLFVPKVTRKMSDFEVYRTAAVRARAAEPLYRVEDGHYQFKYLPAFAVLAFPVGLVALQTAKAVWFAATVALLVALVALSIRVLPQQLRPTPVLVAAIVIAMGKFYGHEIVLGQVNLLFAAVVMMGVWSLVNGRETAGGIWLALAIVVKPYAVLFAPWLAARRRAPSILAFAVCLLVVLALPVALYGVNGTIDLHAAWWRTVAESTAPNLTNVDNVSIAGMYSKWFGTADAVGPLVVATSVLLLAAAGYVFARRRGVSRPEVLEAALILTLVPLLSPQGWDYVFLASTPAIALLANYDARLPSAMRAATIVAILLVGLSLYDVMGRAAYGAFMSLSIVTLCFLVVVAALAALRFRGVA